MTEKTGDLLKNLSARERQVAEHYAQGETYKVIAEALHVSPSTVRSHINKIYEKLGVSNKAELFPLILNTPAPIPDAPAFNAASEVQEDMMDDGSGRATHELPEKPSIAVLPFTNMSGDPEQEYFSDGITEDVITELSRFRELTVIARNSSFVFKSQSVDIVEVGAKLRVLFILEGSVRKFDNRVRVIAQLLDATNGNHIWAERYDRELEDMFTVQDEICQTIVSTLVGRLKVASEDRAKRKPIDNLQAYDYVLRAQSVVSDTKESNEWSREMYERAIELDPECARAISNHAFTYLIEWINNWSDAPDEIFEKAFRLSKKALSLDDADSKSHLRLGTFHLYRKEYDEAMRYYKRSISLNPNDADALATIAWGLTYTGKSEESIAHCEKAIRLNPYYPAWYVWIMGEAYYGLKQYEKAVKPLQEAINRNPKFMMPYRLLAATYAQLGETTKAHAIVEEILADDPDASLKLERIYPYKNPDDLEHWLDGQRKAGLPE